MSLFAQYVHYLCSYLSPAVIISPSYISSHCSDCDNPNDDLPVYMLHVILSERYHKEEMRCSFNDGHDRVEVRKEHTCYISMVVESTVFAAGDLEEVY